VPRIHQWHPVDSQNAFVHKGSVYFHLKKKQAIVLRARSAREGEDDESAA
jgi:hypothetical protein